MSKIDWTIFLQAANFLVLMVVLNFLLYRPVRGILKLRREKIADDFDRAKDLEQRIDSKMAAYQERLEEAKRKANQEKATFRATAIEEETALVTRAREEATGHLQTIKNRVAAEAKEARSALGAEVQNLASRVAAKVLGRNL